MSYEFAGQLYPTSYKAAEGIVREFMTAGGLNSPEQIAQFFAEGSDEQLYADMVDNWTMPEGVEQADLMKAIRYYRMEVEETTSTDE